MCVFEKRSTWCSQIFCKLFFFNHFWKNTQGIVFSTQWIFEHLPPSAINGDPQATFDPIFLSEKLVLYAKQLYIFVQKISTLLNCDRHSHFSKKVHFYKKITTQPFFGQSAPLHPKQKLFFFLAVSCESWRPQHFRTPWSYTMTKEFEEEIIVWT